MNGPLFYGGTRCVGQLALDLAPRTEIAITASDRSIVAAVMVVVVLIIIIVIMTAWHGHRHGEAAGDLRANQRHQ